MLWTVELPGKNNLVCIYPKNPRVWTSSGTMVLALDGVDRPDRKLAVFNASVATLYVKTNNAAPQIVGPGVALMVECVKGENGYPIQVAAAGRGGAKVIANTRMPAGKNTLSTLVFTNADPQIESTGVAMLCSDVSIADPAAPTIAGIIK